MRVPVQLYIRVKIGDSYPYLKAAMQPNGHVRSGYAIQSGRSVKVSGGVYNLSYRVNGKRVWEPIGNDPGLALVKLRAKKRELENLKLTPTTATSAQTSSPEPTLAPAAPPDSKSGPAKRSLSSCRPVPERDQAAPRKEDLRGVLKSMLSFAEHRLSIKENVSLLNGSSAIAIEGLTRDDALGWIAALRKAGSQDRRSVVVACEMGNVDRTERPDFRRTVDRPARRSSENR